MDVKNPDDIRLWDGQFVLSRTSNGFCGYPKLGNKVLTELMIVVEGHNNFGRVGNALKDIYSQLDSMKASYQNELKAEMEMADVLPSENTAGIHGTIEQVAVGHEVDHDNSMAGVQPDKE